MPTVQPISSAVAVLKHRRALQNRLLNWFDSRTRDLPWLVDRTPYQVWVSEIMLQQTQMATVIEYYQRFILEFPSVQRLAVAPIAKVLKCWEGLGYYRRARQMHEAAQWIVATNGGRFPTQIDSLLTLPGIGKYTAAAILSISLEQRHPILEGNTIRLFSRLIGLQDDTSASTAQKQLWQFSESLLPSKRIGDFNQALMDFGREVCKPQNPVCDHCPISKYCSAFSLGLQNVIPFRAKRTQFVELREAIVVIRRRNSILLRQCTNTQRWAGLWDFPRFDLHRVAVRHYLQQAVQRSTGLTTRIENLNITIKHAVTRYRITLECFQAKTVSGRLHRGSQFQWKTRQELDELPLNASARKFADQLDTLR